MSKLPPSILEVIELFEMLPGVGKKTATRYAFWLIKQPKTYQSKLMQAVGQLSQNVQLCQVCWNTTDQATCEICRDPRRDQTLLCIIESPEDIEYIERLGEYSGVYHVLGGTIDPLKGVQSEDINVDSLLQRIHDQAIREIILATNPTLQGDTTANYIRNMLKNVEVKISMLARGLTTGAHIEYVDEKSLKQAFQNRK